MKKLVRSSDEMQKIGAEIGVNCSGGEVIILTGDVGAGKTVFTKGLAKGLGVHDEVQSPTFTISRVYDCRDGLQLAHYDFYRLNEPGIMRDELREALSDPKTITVIEWADIVESVLPKKSVRISIRTLDETVRELDIQGYMPGVSSI